MEGCPPCPCRICSPRAWRLHLWGMPAWFGGSFGGLTALCNLPGTWGGELAPLGTSPLHASGSKLGEGAPRSTTGAGTPGRRGWGLQGLILLALAMHRTGLSPPPPRRFPSASLPQGSAGAGEGACQRDARQDKPSPPAPGALAISTLLIAFPAWLQHPAPCQGRVQPRRALGGCRSFPSPKMLRDPRGPRAGARRAAEDAVASCRARWEPGTASLRRVTCVGVLRLRGKPLEAGLNQIKQRQRRLSAL